MQEQGRDNKKKFNIFKTMTTAYCVKCKEKNAEMKDAKEVPFKRKGGTMGRAMTGIHAKCGTKMFRIMGAAK